MDFDHSPVTHHPEPPQTAEPRATSSSDDARELIERHRAQRDVVGLLRRPEGLIFCHALPRSEEGSPCSIPCPVCAGAGHLRMPRPRPDGAPRKYLAIECPLCLAVGVAEPGYADFANCYQDADLHDVRSFADPSGQPMVVEPFPTDVLMTLAEAHSHLMRQS